MAGCDCACHGHETKAAEQQAPGPDTQRHEPDGTAAQSNTAYDITYDGPDGGALYTDVTGPSKEAVLAATRQEYFNHYGSYPTSQSVGERTTSDASSRASAGFNGTPHGGSAMTAPASNGGGGDIRSVQDMRNFWEQAGTTAASATDPLQNAANQLDALASHLEAVQAHAAEHGDATGGQAAAAAEAYRQLAQKCRDAADAVEPAVAGCASAHQGLDIFRGAEEGLASLPNRHTETRAYEAAV